MVAAQTPPLYAKLMAPQEGRGLNDVCAFVMALAERGVHVEATAVAAPGCATAMATSHRPIAAPQALDLAASRHNAALAGSLF